VLHVSFRVIKPGKEARLREWLAQLNDRADEVRATFRDETVRAEQAFIAVGPQGPMLVYAVEAADFERGAAAFADSQHPIDAEHRAVMQECVGPALDIRPLYDVSAS
jgi:uncharacterized protein DUF6176